MAFLKSFISGCWWSHTQTRQRDAKGNLILVCSDCGAVVPVLQSAVIRGPKAQPDPVLGVPKTKTFTDVVEPFTMKKKRA